MEMKMKMKNKFLIIAASLFTLSSTAFATELDIIGTWRPIDDKTGSSKAIIQINKENDGTYTGKIIKVTPRPGYTPKETCVNCPAPYTNKPMLGLEIIKGLQLTKSSETSTEYSNGRILDPLSGKVYSVKGKLSSNGNRLSLRGYIGVSVIGRSQTWIRER